MQRPFHDDVYRRLRMLLDVDIQSAESSRCHTLGHYKDLREVLARKDWGISLGALTKSSCQISRQGEDNLGIRNKPQGKQS